MTLEELKQARDRLLILRAQTKDTLEKIDDALRQHEFAIMHHPEQVAAAEASGERKEP